MLSGCIINETPEASALGFDYYRCTFKADYFDVLEVLADAFPEPGFTHADALAIRHFGPGTEVRDPQDVRVFALHRVPGTDRAHLIVSGFYSPAVAAAVRHLPHSVARVDVRLDLASPGLFGRLDRLTARFARSHRLTRQVIRNDDLEKGATIYLGSRTSAFFVRIYQVGLKRAKDEGRTGDSISIREASAVRIELEYKPAKGPDKVAASLLDPLQIWACTDWTQKLLDLVAGLKADRVFLVKPDETDLERALRWMCRQYGSRLRELMALHHGDLEAFGADIYSRLPIDSAIKFE